MIENADFVAIINREFSSNTNFWYLTFKRLKIRGKEMTELTYFNHPFADGNKMRLIDDFGGECLSEVSLANTLEGFDDEVSGKKKDRNKNRKKLEDEDFSGTDVIKQIMKENRAG